MNNNDALIGKFLAFLAKDAIDHPERPVALHQDIWERLPALVHEVEIDLNERLVGEDE